MTVQNKTDLTVEVALKVLKTFSCIESKAVTSEAEKQQLRQALLLIVERSEYQNLGICADTPHQATLALAQYLTALGYNLPPKPANSIAEDIPVYLKFNSQKISYYLEPYTGEYRGVLVSCQAADNDAIAGTYGHLPLDLFATV